MINRVPVAAGTLPPADAKDDDLDVSMTGGGGASAPDGNHTNCFLDDAGSPLESQRGEKEEAEIGMSVREPIAVDSEQRLVQYLCEAALELSEDPAAHLHVARTEHTNVLGSGNEMPLSQLRLGVSEIFYGGSPSEVLLGNTIEEAVAATARVFGKALDELAARVPQQPEETEEGEESFAAGPLGGFKAAPFDWRGPEKRYLSDGDYRGLAQAAKDTTNGLKAEERWTITALLEVLKANGHVADPEPPYWAIVCAAWAGESREQAWQTLPMGATKRLPCGNSITITTKPIVEDMLCPCGKPNHWLVRWMPVLKDLNLVVGQRWLNKSGDVVTVGEIYSQGFSPKLHWTVRGATSEKSVIPGHPIEYQVDSAGRLLRHKLPEGSLFKLKDSLDPPDLLDLATPLPPSEIAFAVGQLWKTAKGTIVKILSRHPVHPAWVALDQAQSTTDALRDLVDDEGYAVYIQLPPESGATADRGILTRAEIDGPFLRELNPLPSGV